MDWILGGIVGIIIGFILDWFLFRRKSVQDARNLSVELEASKRQAGEIRSELSTVTTSNAALQEQLMTHESKVTALRVEAEQYSAELSEAGATAAEMQAQVGQLEAANSEMQLSLASRDAELTTLRDELGQRSTELDSVSENVSSLKARISELETANTELSDAAGAHDSQAVSLRTQLEARSAELTAAIAAKTALETSVNELKVRESELSEVADTGKATIDGLESRVAELERSNSELGVRLEACESERDAEEAMLIEAVSELEEYQTEEALATPVATGEPDNLRRIEGVGPKISRVLNAADISYFSQIAAMSPEAIQVILDEAGISRIANPGTWPEQAALAAAGDWDALETLQDSLKGGRRA